MKHTSISDNSTDLRFIVCKTINDFNVRSEDNIRLIEVNSFTYRYPPTKNERTASSDSKRERKIVSIPNEHLQGKMKIAQASRPLSTEFDYENISSSTFLRNSLNARKSWSS